MPVLRPAAGSYLLPAPTGGWNTRDPWSSMAENDALALENIFPDTSFCRVRGGMYQWARLGSDSVRTLAVLALPNGVEKLIGVCGSAIRDATNGGSIGDDINGTVTVTPNALWQHTTFRHRLFMVNGIDQPIHYTGTGDFEATAWSGDGLTITNLINVSTYKSRLYFVEKQSSKIWYTIAVNNVTGTLKSFDFSSQMTKGGMVLYAGPTTPRSNGGTNADELFVVVTSQGEVLIYQGDNPLSPTWGIVRHYYIGRALGYRSCFHVGGDLNVICNDGVVPVSSLLSEVDPTNDYLTQSGKIKPSFITAANSFLGNDNWFGINYPGGHYILTNVPTPIAGTFYQHVMNTINKSWCRFTGWNAQSFAVWRNSTFSNEGLYFGDYNDGSVWLADSQFTTDKDGDQNDVTKDIVIRQAFSYLGEQRRSKILTFISPNISVAENPIYSAFNHVFTVGASNDFDDTTLPIIPDFNLDTGGGGNFAYNKKLLDADGSGDLFSVRIESSLRDHEARIYSTKVYFNYGGEIA